jgi:aldose 1-epimerase
LPTEWINNCFTDWDGSATVTWPDRNLALDIVAKWPCRYYVLYSPHAAADFACFEPVTHATNAHNLPGGPEAHGLIMLAPGAAFSATIRFCPRVAVGAT